jgi:hypothetical protein
MMAPVVVALQRQLQSAGGAAADTPREAAFQVEVDPDSCGFVPVCAMMVAARRVKSTG